MKLSAPTYSSAIRTILIFIAAVAGSISGRADNTDPDSVPLYDPDQAEIVAEKFATPNDSAFSVLGTDTLAVANAYIPFSEFDRWEYSERVFNPSPTRAVWLSALFPGLGQIYNRRYWKLPIIVGGFMGLGYATSWNNKMLNDYQRAYLDIMDSDPSTNSYMNFFPPNTNEADLDHKWLQDLLRSRKDFYRRNRDLCIIGMVGVYLLAMVDAYVDASLSHFDISPDLSMDVIPTLINDGRAKLPSFGLSWALNF